MSRRDRRADVRAARRDLRARGCRCHADIALLPNAHVKAVGASIGAMIRHQKGCPFGDQFVPLNRAGLMPSLVTSAGCRR